MGLDAGEPVRRRANGRRCRRTRRADAQGRSKRRSQCPGLQRHDHGRADGANSAGGALQYALADAPRRRGSAPGGRRRVWSGQLLRRPAGVRDRDSDGPRCVPAASAGTRHSSGGCASRGRNHRRWHRRGICVSSARVTVDQCDVNRSRDVCGRCCRPGRDRCRCRAVASASGSPGESCSDAARITSALHVRRELRSAFALHRALPRRFRFTRLGEGISSPNTSSK